MPDNTFPVFVNAHTHSHSMPFKGSVASAPFDIWIAYRLASNVGRLSAPEQVACALACGLENLNAGNAAIIDHLYSPITEENVYGVAEAYESLGIRAWVFPNIDNLPVGIYTRRFYPKYPKAIPDDSLPEEVLARIEPLPFEPRLEALVELIKGWSGKRVQIGLALGNAVWCTDALLEAARDTLAKLDVPLEIHVEESPVQREAAMHQWGMSGVQRLDKFGLLTERTLAAHCVQVSREDIDLLADRGVSVSHNPLSNMKLQNGITPIGTMLREGVNVALGSDGSNSGDEQGLGPVMRLVASLARLNGLQQVSKDIEPQVVKLGSANGHRLWFPQEIGSDRIEYSGPVDPVKLVWTNAASNIEEVYIDDEPTLENARSVFDQSNAAATIADLAKNAISPEGEELVRQIHPLLQWYAQSK